MLRNRLAVCLALLCLLPVAGRAQQPQPRGVIMTQQDGDWIVTLPTGTTLTALNSTSQGLQEAINWAQRYGTCLFVYGAQETGNVDNGQIAVTATIRIAPSAKGCFHFYAVSLWCQQTGTDCLDIGASDMLDFDFGGQIIYSGTTSAIGLYVGGSYQEGDHTYAAFTSSRIRIMSIACISGDQVGGPGTGISVNPFGPFTFNTLEVNEINGCATPTVTYPGPGPVTGNTWDVRGVH